MDRLPVLAGLLVGRSPCPAVRTLADWMELVALAQAEDVSALLARVLRGTPELEVPAPSQELLASDYHASVVGSLRQEAVRTSMCACLSQNRIPVLLLKGAALVLTCYDDPATRPMGDLDLLVARSHIEEAARCLEQSGFRPYSGSVSTERRSPRGHLVFVHAVTGVTVELHWELKLLGRAQKRATAEIWAGARTAEAVGSPLVMRPGHTLPLLCAHMLLQHRQPRLIWLYDLHRLLLQMDAAEARLAREAATRWRLGPCTALALSRVHELFGTSLPEELAGWVRAMVTRRDLQARVAAQALSQGAAEAPSEYLISLVMSRNYSLRSLLFPPLPELRLRLGKAPGERVGLSAYAAFLAWRLRNGPLYLSQLWRFWRTAPQPPRSETISAPSGGTTPAERE